jgi:hypothetical protein
MLFIHFDVCEILHSSQCSIQDTHTHLIQIISFVFLGKICYKRKSYEGIWIVQILFACTSIL